MLKIAITSKFKRDLKKAIKQGKNKQKLDEIVSLLQEKKPLPEKNRDHALIGNYLGYRECHIMPDWLLIYRIKEDDSVELLELARTGSHSELFN